MELFYAFILDNLSNWKQNTQRGAAKHFNALT